MAHDVFISYSSKDKMVADAVVANIEQEKIRCWIAPRDLTPGMSWGEGISAAIQASKIMVVVLSKNANASKQVAREVERAVFHDVIIIPFRIDKTEPTGSIGYFLSSEHWLDAITPPLQRHIDKLVDVIMIFLTRKNQPLSEPPALAKDKEEEKKRKGFIEYRNIKLIFAVFLLVFSIGVLLYETIIPPVARQSPSPSETDTPDPFVHAYPRMTENLTKQPTPSSSPTEALPSFTNLDSVETPKPSQTVTQTNNIGSTFQNPKDGSEFVFVPEGSFLMGGMAFPFSGTIDVDLHGNDDRSAMPDREIYLDAFWIQKYEVTVGQYWECVIDGLCQESTSNLHENYPINEIDWVDANTYCEWIGGRLPTEAEWEKAARGTDGRLFPWGNDLPDLASDGVIGFFEISPVGKFPEGASPYGVMDMAGNVWEWVADWFNPDYYSYMASENPTGPDSGEDKVIRGGSFNYPGYTLSSANRHFSSPDTKNEEIGFRCVMDID
jgi:formylglycine-generating enzyme required for sulfatase activity